MKPATKYDPKTRNRHSIRLQGYDYSQAGAYFVTICTGNRESMFGDIANGKMLPNEHAKIVELTWHDLTGHYKDIELDAFVIMPNHIHGIIVLKDNLNVGAGFKPALRECAPTNTIKPYSLPEIVRAFKTFSARRINESCKTGARAGFKPAPTKGPVWQRNYYEHVIRNEDELNRIREYILNNPLRGELDRENPLSANFNLDYKEYFNGIYDPGQVLARP